VIEPCYLDQDSQGYEVWKKACLTAELAYFDMLSIGYTPQEARAVLPNSLKTEVVMTANIREWRHFLRLRCSPAAHPQMREAAMILLGLVCDAMPALFNDIAEEVKGTDE
jgi:thymidylate synthase (FAD)